MSATIFSSCVGVSTFFSLLEYVMVFVPSIPVEHPEKNIEAIEKAIKNIPESIGLDFIVLKLKLKRKEDVRKNFFTKLPKKIEETFG